MLSVLLVSFCDIKMKKAQLPTSKILGHIAADQKFFNDGPVYLNEKDFYSYSILENKKYILHKNSR